MHVVGIVFIIIATSSISTDANQTYC